MTRRLARLLLALLLVAGAAVLAMWIVGTGLPAEHTASVATTIDAPQGRVWQLLEDIDDQPAWRTGLQAVEPMPSDSDGHRCWAERAHSMRLPLCEVLVVSPTTRIVSIVDPNLSFGGSWTYTVTALTPTTTGVSITEHGITRPALWRFIGHYVYGEDTQIRQYLRDLEKASQAK